MSSGVEGLDRLISGNTHNSTCKSLLNKKGRKKYNFNNYRVKKALRGLTDARVASETPRSSHLCYCPLPLNATGVKCFHCYNTVMLLHRRTVKTCWMLTAARRRCILQHDFSDVDVHRNSSVFERRGDEAAKR